MAGGNLWQPEQVSSDTEKTLDAQSVRGTSPLLSSSLPSHRGKKEASRGIPESLCQGSLLRSSAIAQVTLGRVPLTKLQEPPYLLSQAEPRMRALGWRDQAFLQAPAET